jgi:hypothetical protein
MRWAGRSPMIISCCFSTPTQNRSGSPCRRRSSVRTGWYASIPPPGRSIRPIFGPGEPDRLIGSRRIQCWSCRRLWCRRPNVRLPSLERCGPPHRPRKRPCDVRNGRAGFFRARCSQPTFTLVAYGLHRLQPGQTVGNLRKPRFRRHGGGVRLQVVQAIDKVANSRCHWDDC